MDFSHHGRKPGCRPPGVGKGRLCCLWVDALMRPRCLDRKREGGVTWVRELNDPLSQTAFMPPMTDGITAKWSCVERTSGAPGAAGASTKKVFATL